ncbi:MAG: hypothetical protein HEQ16_00955 [Bosea sp.]|nr:hypothetical protein [Bosea sp. (in: a-proteobacteria)]
MKPETTGLALIAEVERTIAAELVPQLAGEARYKALMAASALRMALRELGEAPPRGGDAADAADAARAALCAALRAGSADADAGLHAELVADAIGRVRISNPAALAGEG